MDTNLKHDNGSVTFILQMDVAGDTDEAREWVAERSVKTVFEITRMELAASTGFSQRIQRRPF